MACQVPHVCASSIKKTCTCTLSGTFGILEKNLAAVDLDHDKISPRLSVMQEKLTGEAKECVGQSLDSTAENLIFMCCHLMPFCRQAFGRWRCHEDLAVRCCLLSYARILGADGCHRISSSSIVAKSAKSCMYSILMQFLSSNCRRLHVVHCYGVTFCSNEPLRPGIDLGDFLLYCPRQRPREYTIASSPAAAPKKITLCVAWQQILR